MNGPHHQVLVVADDLTGANATAAGFARMGLRAVTVGAGQDAEVIAEFAGRFDVVVVSTDSRHAHPSHAAEQVARSVRAGWPVRLVSNRVDTTLRGNVSATTAAALRAVADEAGMRAVGLCAPAFPAARRQTVDGTQLLDGVRLEHTELARDPRSPMDESDIATILRRQAQLSIGHIPLSDVTSDPADLRSAFHKQAAAGVDVLIVDALTDDHLDRMARAAVDTGGEDMVWVSIDSGPGALALTAALSITGHVEGAPVLAVSGSATDLTRAQLARLRAERRVTTVRTVCESGSPVPDIAATAAALDAALMRTGADDVVLLATVLDDADVAALDLEQAERLPRALARAVRRALEEHPVDALFATGGDVTAALFAELAASGLEVETEVEPLAVAGTFASGPWAGLPVATKGGLVGGDATMVTCVDHLRRTADATRRHVRAAQSRSVAGRLSIRP
ncbi:four-carbon acid sugar kinase family protein [Phytoactinopolyspora halotolerans]|uniref:four-carbon acid sugar kinase family protein n=1 Tax=Phytoactinopolyspora halotolerans TaxID=1981512 RepID=UPI001C202261|nr:four-carbon acid sugar kinase family protein [Phytoactinopolyspora halotolerans]